MKFHSCPVVAQAAEEKLGQLPCQILFSPHIAHLAAFCRPILIPFHSTYPDSSYGDVIK